MRRFHWLSLAAMPVVFGGCARITGMTTQVEGMPANYVFHDFTRTHISDRAIWRKLRIGLFDWVTVLEGTIKTKGSEVLLGQGLGTGGAGIAKIRSRKIRMESGWVLAWDGWKRIETDRAKIKLLEGDPTIAVQIDVEPGPPVERILMLGIGKIRVKSKSTNQVDFIVDTDSFVEIDHAGVMTQSPAAGSPDAMTFITEAGKVAVASGWLIPPE